MSLKTRHLEELEQPAEPLNLDFARAVINGLSQTNKAIPSRFFYDARGSALFEEITKQPEYYPTRTETAILSSCVDEIAKATAPGSVLVEFGSGSSLKTELLLSSLPELYAYAPIDISPVALDDAKERLTQRYPSLRVLPVVGDFSKTITLDDRLATHPRIGFFPGSTIGNLGYKDAIALLKNMAQFLGSGARLIIGVDLKKNVQRLIAAYDDAAGVTAQFNFNLLKRINRELGADFDVDAFEHQASYNAHHGRMESHLVSLKAQTVFLLGRVFHFAEGEGIHTENSHKYDLKQFARMADLAGWQSKQIWSDTEDLFSVHELHAR